MFEFLVKPTSKISSQQNDRISPQ